MTRGDRSDELLTRALYELAAYDERRHRPPFLRFACRLPAGACHTCELICDITEHLKAPPKAKAK